MAAAFQPTEGCRSDAAAAWIACVASVFAHYGHRVPQSTVAADAYGGLAAVPLQDGFGMARTLDRMWTDATGTMFRVAVEALYDGALQDAHPDPLPLVEALAAGDPIILSVGGHPVVMTALTLIRRNAAWAVRGSSVFDPLPGAGSRRANEAETRTILRGDPRSFAMTVRFPGLG